MPVFVRIGDLVRWQGIQHPEGSREEEDEEEEEAGEKKRKHEGGAKLAIVQARKKTKTSGCYT